MFKGPKLFYGSEIETGDSMRQRYLSPAIVAADMSHSSTFARLRRHSCACPHTSPVPQCPRTYTQTHTQPTDPQINVRRARSHSRTLQRLGGAWGISWHAVYLTSKSWGGDENIWVSEDINLTKSYGTPLHMFYAALRAIVFEILPLAVRWKAIAAQF